jgi:hypothetical protein
VTAGCAGAHRLITTLRSPFDEIAARLTSYPVAVDHLEESDMLDLEPATSTDPELRSGAPGD